MLKSNLKIKRVKEKYLLVIIFIFTFILISTLGYSLVFDTSYVSVGSGASFSIGAGVNYSGVVDAGNTTNFFEIKYDIEGSGVQGKVFTSNVANFSTIVDSSSWFDLDNGEGSQALALDWAQYAKYVLKRGNLWNLTKVEFNFNSSAEAENISVSKLSDGYSKTWYGVYDILIEANATDPDGWDDISFIELNLTKDPTLVNSDNMSLESSFSAYGLNANYTYSIQSNDPSGVWNVSVEPTDGNPGVTNSILINVDTNTPGISYSDPTPDDSDVIKGVKYINVSSNDTGGSNLSQSVIYIYNNSGALEDSYTCDCNQEASFYCNYTWNTSQFSDGNYTFNASVNDTARNIQYSSNREIIVDNTAPVSLEFEWPPYSKYQHDDDEFNFILNATDLTSGLRNISLYFYNSSGDAPDSLIRNATNNNCNGNSTCHLYANFSEIQDGIYFFNSTAFDLASNIKVSDTWNITVDTFSPELDYVNITDEGYLGRNYIQVNVTAEEVIGVGVASVSTYLYNSTWDQINSSTVDCGGLVSCYLFSNFTGLEDSVYYYNSSGEDMIGNPERLELRNITIDTSPPSCYVSDVDEISGRIYQHYENSTLYYNTEGSGAFVVDVNATDTLSGVDYITFPDLVSSGGDNTSLGPIYSWEYTWDDSDFESTGTITCYDMIPNSNTSSITLDKDVSEPSGGSVSYTNGYVNSITLNLNTGTDNESGVNSSSDYIERKEATLSGGECVNWGPWSVVKEDPSASWEDTTIQDSKCYNYTYKVLDNVANEVTYTNSSIIKTDLIAPSVSEVFINDTTINNFTYTKDGDILTITAIVTDSSLASGETQYIEANATVFGYEEDRNPDSYDGTTATWTLTGVDTIPVNGIVNITVTGYDKIGNSNSSSDTINADNQATVCSLDNIEQVTNTEYQHVVGSTVYYNTETSGSFRLDIDGSDVTAGGVASGDKNTSFPNIFSSDGGFNTSGPSYSWTYNWEVSEDYSGDTETITCYDNVLHSNTTSVTLDRDVSEPSGTAIGYLDGFATTSLNVYFSDGTDSESGINMSARYIERQNTTLAEDMCSDSWGSWDVVNVSPSGSPWQDQFGISESNYCYRYRYRVFDNVYNMQTATNSSIVRIDTIAPFVNLTYPTGGEIIQDVINITWNATDSCSPNSGLSISIEYSNDSGSSWTILDADTENDGTYEWNSSTVGDTNHFRIRINASDTAGMENSSSSQDFTLANHGPILHSFSINTSNVSGPSEEVSVTFNATRMGAVIEDCWVGLELHDDSISTYLASQTGDIESEIQCTVSVNISQVGNFSITPYVNDSGQNVKDETPETGYRWDHVSIEHIYGNNSRVDRISNNEITLKARVYDTDTNQYIYLNEGFTTADTCLYVTTDGSSYSLVESNQDVDSNSYSNITFNPDTSYSAIRQKWMIGACNSYNDFYQDTNSSEFYLDIYGNITHDWRLPSQGSEHSVGDNIIFRWNVTEYDTGELVPGLNSTIKIRLNNETNWTDITSECNMNDEGDGFYNCSWDSLWYSGGTYDVRINSSQDTVSRRYNNNPTVFSDRFTLVNATVTGEIIVSYNTFSDRKVISSVPDTVSLNFTFENTGNNALYNASVNLSSIDRTTGEQYWSWVPISYECGNLSIGQNCSGQINVTIPVQESSGWKIIYLTSTWLNPDNSVSSDTDDSNVEIPTIGKGEINESYVNETIAHGQSKIINFTVISTGNTITDVWFNITDGSMENWTHSFDPVEGNLQPQGYNGDLLNVSLNISVPEYHSNDTYWANVTIHTEEEPYYGNISDWMIINVTVPLDDSWNISTSVTSYGELIDNYNVEGNISPRDEDYPLFSVNITNTGNNNLSFYTEGIGPPFGGSPKVRVLQDGGSIQLGAGESEVVNYSIHFIQLDLDGTLSDNTFISNTDENIGDPSEYEVNVTLNILDLPPQIAYANLSNDRVDMNFESVDINATVLDYIEINSVWANVTYSDNLSDVTKVDMTRVSGDLQEGNWTGSFIPTQVSPYYIVVYARDSGGLVSNSSQMTLRSAKTADINIGTNISSTTVYNITQSNGGSFSVRVSLNGSDEEDEGAGYFSNLTILPGDGMNDWNFSPPHVYYGTLSEGSSESDNFDVTVPAGEPDGTYNLRFAINWTNPINTTEVRYASVTVEVNPNPQIDIDDDLDDSDFNINHGSSENATITIHSTGNDKAENIVLSCASGTACSSFNFTFNESNFEINETESKNITMTISVPPGYSPTTYAGAMISASGDGGILDSSTVYVSVPEDGTWSWTKDPIVFNKTVGALNNGTLGTITVNNSGNIDLDFTVTESGTGTGYISESNTSFTVAKRTESSCVINNITAYYNAPSNIQTYYPNLRFSAGSGDPSQRNFTFMLKVLNLTAHIRSPLGEGDTLSGILAGQNITGRIKSDAIVEGIEVEDSSVLNWTVYVEENEAEITNYSWNGEEWVIDIVAPDLADGETYDLKTTAHYTNVSEEIYDAQASDTSANSIRYLDITAPNATNLSYVAVGPNETATISAICTDNIGIDRVNITIYHPEGTEYTGLMTPVSSNTYNYSFTNTTQIGDYNYNVTCFDNQGLNDTSGNWFEVYLNVTLNVTSKQPNGSAANVSYDMLRPSTGQVLNSFEINQSTGKASVTVHRRTYNMKSNAYDVDVTFNGVDIENHTEYNISIEDIETSDLAIGNVTGIMGFYMNPTLSHSSADIKFYYSSGLVTTEDDIRIYKCSNWDTSVNNCSGSWGELDDSGYSLNKVSDTISINVNSFSAYAIGEIEYSYTPDNDTDDTNITIPETSSGGGGGGSSVSWIPSFNDILLQINKIERQMRPGEEATDSIAIKNMGRRAAIVKLNISGEVSRFLNLVEEVEIASEDTEEIEVGIKVPKGTSIGLYTGKIGVKFGASEKIIPVNIEVIPPLEEVLDIKLDLFREEVHPGDILKYKVSLFNLGSDKSIDLNLTSKFMNISENVILENNENLSLNSSISVVREFIIPNSTSEGDYIVTVSAGYSGQTVTTSDFMRVTKERKALSWIPYEYKVVMFEWRYLIIGVIAAFILGIYLTKKFYQMKKKKNPFGKPSISALPKKGVWLGKVAAEKNKVFLTMRDLTMHTISVGSTGAGKTVASQVIVEEALKKGVNVLVLDPTAQWTGFLRKNKDENMFNMYEKFGMKKSDAQSFDGNIRAIEDPNEKIDIIPYLKKTTEGKEGFIQIFSLHKLKYKEISKFVGDMIQQVFDANLEESNSIDTLIVFDEVHRLLERFGGSAEAQKQLERGVREFRKWGVGIMLISQVISDFNREVLANIGTKIQMRTRDKKDLIWIKTQYGLEYVRNIVRTKIGRGMLQNAEYNNGTPFFVDVRPLIHSPHKLTNEELKKYEDYNKSIIAFESRVKELEKSGQDVFDLTTTLNLTKKNLMKGKFDMVDIYLDELKDKVK